MKVFPEASPTPRWKAMSLATRTLASSRNSSPGIDITDVASVREFFNQAGSFDAIVAALGSAPFAYLKDANTEDFQAGLNNKLQGQINLVLHGLDHLVVGGSFTLITGILAQHPVEKSVIASTVNGGLEAFIYAASTDIPPAVSVLIRIAPTSLKNRSTPIAPSSRASNQFAHKASPILCPLRPWRGNWPNLQGLVNKLKNGRWPTERLSVGQRPLPIYKGDSSTYEN